MGTWQWILSPLYSIVIGESADAACKTKNKNKGSWEKSSLVNINDPEKRSHGMFQMPLHYPRYKKEDYEEMEEWKVDMLLKEYGLNVKGSLEEKRKFAMGAFLWPDQL